MSVYFDVCLFSCLSNFMFVCLIYVCPTLLQQKRSQWHIHCEKKEFRKSVFLFINLSVYVTVCLCVCLSALMPDFHPRLLGEKKEFSKPFFLYVCLYVTLHFHLTSFVLYVNLSVFMSLSPHLHLFILHLTFFISNYICVSISMFVMSVSHT